MLQAVIDRFEGNKAVLLLGVAEITVVFPKALLPAGVAEGDYLRLDIAVDDEATRQARREAEALLADLQGKGK